MVLDNSWSMEGQRIRDATAGARDLLAIALTDSYLVGLVTFCQRARTVLELTTDLREVDRALENVTLDGGTDMSTGIELAHQTLKQRRGERVMAIFSDGETNRSKAIRAADAAKRDDIRIIGAPGGDADPRLMREIVSGEQSVERVKDRDVRETISGLARSIQPTWQRRH